MQVLSENEKRARASAERLARLTGKGTQAFYVRCANGQHAVFEWNEVHNMAKLILRTFTKGTSK